MSNARLAPLVGAAVLVAAVLGLFLLADDGSGPEYDAETGAESIETSPTPSVALDPRVTPRPLADTELVEATPVERPVAAATTPRPEQVAIEVWSGKVRRPDGSAVAGADVSWFDPSRDDATGFLLRTDHEGRFLFDRAPPGPLLLISAAHHADQVVPVGEPGRPLTIVLLPQRTVLGDVVAAEDGRPLAGAQVEAESASWRGSTQTDATGRFELAPPEGESINLFVSYPQRVARVQSEDEGLTVQLDRGRRVQGRLVGPAGQPREGAVFVYGAAQLTRPHRATADSQGHFEVYGIAPDEELAVLGFAEGMATPWELSWLQPGTDGFDVVVVPHGHVTLVRAPEGVVTLRAADAPMGTGASRASPQDVVDPLGGMERAQRVWDQLPAGSYQLELDGRARGPVVPVASGEEVRLSWRDHVLDLEASVVPDAEEGSLRVQVMVLDARGAAVEGATVVASFGETHRTTETDDRGAAVFERLPERPITFSATQAGRVLLRPEFVDPAESQGGHVVLTLTEPVTLSGQVVPPSPAMLRLALAGSDEVVMETRAGNDGRFELSGLVPASYQLSVAADGRVPVDLQLTLPLTGPLRIELAEAEHRHGDDGH